MKPVVSAGNAWSCTVVSFFALIILTIIGILFKREHWVFNEDREDPENPQAVASTIFTAVFVYFLFFLFCGFQAFLHTRQRRIEL